MRLIEKYNENIEFLNIEIQEFKFNCLKKFKYFTFEKLESGEYVLIVSVNSLSFNEKMLIWEDPKADSFEIIGIFDLDDESKEFIEKIEKGSVLISDYIIQ